MAAEPTKAIKIFYCYAHEDKTLRDQLEKHLKPFERLKQIAQWYDGEIKPGMEWERELHLQLNTADIVLLLISSDFMNSDYCYGIEMAQALERQKIGDACVIPIIIRPVAWEETPIGKLQVLPTNAKAITAWSNRDEAFVDVAKGVQDTVAAFLTRKMQTWMAEGEAYRSSGQHTKAITAFERAIYLDPHNLLTDRRTTRGLMASANEQALAACEEAIENDPNNALLYKQIADLLQNLVQHEEALDAYDQAIRLDPVNISLYRDQVEIFKKLHRNEEALTLFNQIIHHSPTISSYREKAKFLESLQRNNEALAVYEQIIRQWPGEPSTYHEQSIILQTLGRLEEAYTAYKAAESRGYYKRFHS